MMLHEGKSVIYCYYYSVMNTTWVKMSSLQSVFVYFAVYTLNIFYLLNLFIFSSHLPMFKWRARIFTLQGQSFMLY